MTFDCSDALAVTLRLQLKAGGSTSAALASHTPSRMGSVASARRLGTDVPMTADTSTCAIITS